MHVRTAIIILLAAATLSGQSRGDWPMFGHDYASTRYSPLTQITTKNVGNLKQAWIYHFRTDEERKSAAGGGLGGYSEVTPIVVNGVTVPGNSVYWDLGVVPEGTTDLLSFTAATKPGWPSRFATSGGTFGAWSSGHDFCASRSSTK